jgi:hypothetical protein
MTEQEFTKTHLSIFTPQQLAAVKAVERAPVASPRLPLFALMG